MMMLVIGFGRTMIPSTYLHNMVLRFEICACATSAPFLNTPETPLPALFNGGVFSLIGKSTPVHVLLAYRGMCKTRDDYLSGKKTIA
jgi:hypothetical protein